METQNDKTAISHASPKKQTGKPAKLYKFLNSAFGIWLLSSVVIGVFSYLFNEYSQANTAMTAREAEIKQLDVEIESRISQFWVNLDPLVNHKDTTSYPLLPTIRYDTIKQLWEAFKNSPTSNPSLMTPIYPDYTNRSTLSLMVELSTLLKEEDGLGFYSNYKNYIKPIRNTLTHKFTNTKDSTIHDIKKIEQASEFIAKNGVFCSCDKPSVKDMWNLFKSNIILPRWEIQFPYTDRLFATP